MADPVNDTQTLFDEVLPSGAEVLRGNPENVKYWIDTVLKGVVPATPTTTLGSPPSVAASGRRPGTPVPTTP